MLRIRQIKTGVASSSQFSTPPYTSEKAVIIGAKKMNGFLKQY